MKHKKTALVALFGLLTLASCGNKVVIAKPLKDSWVGDFNEVAPTTGLANGVKNFAVASADDRKELLRVLESYTLDNYLGGIPYRDNSGYVLYNSRLVIPSDTYVPGYGYGVLEGSVTGPLTHADITPAHNMYYHSRMAKDPGTANYLDGQDSVTSDVHALINASYWSTRFNADKTGYEWYPQLAVDPRPVALNADEYGMATKWRVKVNVGGNLKYNTLSTKTELQPFKGRAVALADYLTPFELMLNEGWFRATDLGSRSSGFVGVGAYLDGDKATRTWDGVGIKLNEAETAIEFEFNTPKTQFYAMYNLSSSLFSPIPADFITAIGGAKEYGKPNIDSMLSLNTFMLERWEANKEIVFAKNPTWIEADKSEIPGYKYVVITDTNVAFQDFLAGKLDGIGVPSARLQEFKNDPRARQTLGSTVWKLQVNATDPARWNELFGPEGTISPKSEWELKPVMSNKNFLNGLYYSIDRGELAEEQGSRPAQAFLSDAYMIDPENGLSFRDSAEGKDVIKDRLPATHGYSKELAKTFFKAAMEELVEDGSYKAPGRKAETIVIKLIFQDQDQVETEGKTLERYFESAFDEAKTGFKLDVQSYATSDWMDAYYAAMYGEFDLAFGSISGNTLDPINFMDTVRSDNSTGFTLSWGVDTSSVSSAVKFKDEFYAFDSLQEASQGLSVLKEGLIIPTFELDIDSVVDWYFEDLVGGVAKDVALSGTYYDEDPDLVVEVVGASFIIYDEDAKVLSVVDADVVVQADGEWSITLGDLPFPEGSYYLDIEVYYNQTYKGGFPEARTELLELYAPGV